MPDQHSSELALSSLESLIIEDDGSAEWQYVIDLCAVLVEALGSSKPIDIVEVTIRTYLEGIFNVWANELAVKSGRPVSQLAAEQQMASEESWIATFALVTAL
jgi:hypothetical protein